MVGRRSRHHRERGQQEPGHGGGDAEAGLDHNVGGGTQ